MYEGNCIVYSWSRLDELWCFYEVFSRGIRKHSYISDDHVKTEPKATASFALNEKGKVRKSIVCNLCQKEGHFWYTCSGHKTPKDKCNRVQSLCHYLKCLGMDHFKTSCYVHLKPCFNIILEGITTTNWVVTKKEGINHNQKAIDCSKNDHKARKNEHKPNLSHKEGLTRELCNLDFWVYRPSIIFGVKKILKINWMEQLWARVWAKAWAS